MEKVTRQTRGEFEDVNNFLKRGGKIVVHPVPLEYCPCRLENPVYVKGRPMDLSGTRGCFCSSIGGV